MHEEIANTETEYLLPCAEALLAGTLALMTAHAQNCCLKHRQLIQAKIVVNLAQLGEARTLTPQFRAALGNVRTHWQALRDASVAASASPDQPLWHASPALIQ